MTPHPTRRWHSDICALKSCLPSLKLCIEISPPPSNCLRSNSMSRPPFSTGPPAINNDHSLNIDCNSITEEYRGVKIIIYPWLRLPHRNDAEMAKICNLWTFWLVFQLINHLFKIRQKAFLPNAP